MSRKTADQHVSALRDSVARASLQRSAVSQWSVGMHIHHCALGMVGICEAVLDSTPPAPPSSFSFSRALVFATGWIPRGRGTAPEAARPSAGIRPEELNALLDQSDELLARVRDAELRQWWKHFAFGVMNRDQVLRFIGIHNRHHLRIIADIQAGAG